MDGMLLRSGRLVGWEGEKIEMSGGMRVRLGRVVMLRQAWFEYFCELCNRLQFDRRGSVVVDCLDGLLSPALA